MRRFNKLKKSFPFLANFHVYRVSFVCWQIDAFEDILNSPPDFVG